MAAGQHNRRARHPPAPPIRVHGAELPITGHRLARAASRGASSEALVAAGAIVDDTADEPEQDGRAAEVDRDRVAVRPEGELSGAR